jgi:periplasmic protein TonB
VRQPRNSQGAPDWGRPARKIMIAAIAISLLLHFILAGYLPWPFGRESATTQVVKVRVVTIARIPPHTPPPPTPAPTPRPTPAIKTTTKIVPPKTAAHGNKGLPVAHAVVPAAGKSAAPSATPAPTPSAAPVAQACLQHDISPAVSATADPVQIPPDARASKASGVAAIAVQIDPQGHVSDAAVQRSSGNAGLDSVAVQMAKGATYTPALVKCKPVASTYTFTVRFVAW